MRWAASLLTMPLLLTLKGFIIERQTAFRWLGSFTIRAHALRRPEGDYGRQRRQREVLIELTNKLLSFNSLLKYQEILDVIGEHGETDLSFDQMMAMLKNTPRTKTIETDQLKATITLAMA